MTRVALLVGMLAILAGCGEPPYYVGIWNVTGEDLSDVVIVGLLSDFQVVRGGTAKFGPISGRYPKELTVSWTVAASRAEFSEVVPVPDGQAGDTLYLVIRHTTVDIYRVAPENEFLFEKKLIDKEMVELNPRGWQGPVSDGSADSEMQTDEKSKRHSWYSS